MERGLAGRDRANRMYDAYGALLTPRQRRLLRLYYEDDLSLGEIASRSRISRQAVHDGIRRALFAMERLEAALRLAGGVAGGRAPRAAAGEHYFVEQPGSGGRQAVLRVGLGGRSWVFRTAGGVFSRARLDAGTRLLVEAMRIEDDDLVLDLGCGYGPIGLVAAALATAGRVVLTDINRRAAALAAANAAANGVGNALVIVGDGAAALRGGSVDVVVTNPPIRAGRKTVLAFLDGARRVLRPGGRLYFVARTAQGARTLAHLAREMFEEVHQIRSADGYRVYEAKRAADV